MQRSHRTVHREVNSYVAPVAKEHQRPSALVHRTVRRHQQIRAQQILVQLQRFLQIWRTRLFLALKDHLEVHRQRNPFHPQRIQRREQRHNGRFIIGSRPRVNPPIVVINAARPCATRWKRDSFSSRFNRRAAQHRFEWRTIGPSCGIDGLPIIVGVENHGALRFR